MVIKCDMHCTMCIYGESLPSLPPPPPPPLPPPPLPPLPPPPLQVQ